MRKNLFGNKYLIYTRYNTFLHINSSKTIQAFLDGIGAIACILGVYSKYGYETKPVAPRASERERTLATLISVRSIVVQVTCNPNPAQTDTKLQTSPKPAPLVGCTIS